MKKFNLLKNSALYLAMMMFVAVFFVGCNNDEDDEDSDEFGDWVERSVFDGVARGNAASFTIGTMGYVVGGYNGETDTYFNDAWGYNSDANFWFQVDANPGVERSGAVAFSIGDKGYYGFGRDSDGTLYSDFWEFDPSADAGSQWTELTAVETTVGTETVVQTVDLEEQFGLTSRSRAIGFSIGEFGYVGTGSDGSDQKDFWRFDPSDNSWTLINGYGGDKRRNAAVFVINDVAYIGSGESNGAFLEDFYSFDGTTWTELSDIDDDPDDDDDVSVLITNSVGFTINGKGYLATGDRGTISSAVFEYTPSTDSWEQLGNFEGTSREGASSFSFGDSGFVFGGFLSSSSYFDDMFELFPDTIQD